MRTGILAFLVGVVVLQLFQRLPGMGWSALLVLSLPFSLVSNRHVVRLLAGGLSGFLWALLQAHLILSQSLPDALEGQDLTVTGEIAGLPQDRGRSVRFVFDVHTLSYQDRDYASPGRIRLSWYGWAPKLQVGERWRLQVRLKQPHGFMNPGGFDYAGWLYQQRIRATGYVRKSPINQKIREPSSGYFTDRFRAFIRDGSEDLARAQPDMMEVLGLIQGLAIGERYRMTETQWQWLRETGTSHLLAISGMHIGLVAGLIFLFTNVIWRRWPVLVRHWPAPKAAAVAAFLAAMLYSAMAGFSIPTQRALIMLSVVMLMILADRRLSASRVLSLALLGVLVFDPLAVLAPGFWLSFLAVAVIMYGVSGRAGASGRGLKVKARQWLRAQWWVSLGLMPVTLLFFQQVSLISPLANLVAIPLVSLLVVPVTLSGCLLLAISESAAGMLLWVAAKLLIGLMALLELLASQPYAAGQAVVPNITVGLMAGLGVIWLLSPRGLPGRWLGLLLLLPLLLVKHDRPEQGQAWFSLLDVGQGLAAVIQTHDHVLVFDTGPRFSERFDAGESVIAPFLRQAGYPQIDRLVISHGDSDHAGGASSLLARVPAKSIITSAVQKLRNQGMAPVSGCHAGQSWSWEGVHFEFIHPAQEKIMEENEASCVLRISAGGQRVLLTGDIEKRAEKRMVNEMPDKLDADILIAPHHGSKTSSTAAFIRAVSPDYALFSVGYRNRYRFPHPDVLARYQTRGINTAETSQTGTIRFVLGRFVSDYDAEGGDSGLSPDYYRQTHGHYWH